MVSQTCRKTPPILTPPAAPLTLRTGVLCCHEFSSQVPICWFESPRRGRGGKGLFRNRWRFCQFARNRESPGQCRGQFCDLWDMPQAPFIVVVRLVAPFLAMSGEHVFAVRVSLKTREKLKKGLKPREKRTTPPHSTFKPVHYAAMNFLLGCPSTGSTVHTGERGKRASSEIASLAVLPI